MTIDKAPGAFRSLFPFDPQGRDCRSAVNLKRCALPETRRWCAHEDRTDPAARRGGHHACAIRRQSGLFLRVVEPRAHGRGGVRYRFRAGQPFALRAGRHGARAAFPGAAPCAGQARALRARAAFRRGGGYPPRQPDLRALVRSGAELRERAADAGPRGVSARLCHARAGDRDHLQMQRLLRARLRWRGALRRSGHRHRLGHRRHGPGPVGQGRTRAGVRRFRLAVRVEG